MGVKSKINFIAKIAICLSLVIVYSCSNIITYAKDKEALYVGMFQSPILDGQRVEFYAITNNFVNPLFRVFINDGKKEYELTSKYVQGIKEDGYYRVILDNVFAKGSYKLKIWIKDENSINLYDDEKYINGVEVIEDKNYDKDLIAPIVAENMDNKSDDSIKKLVDITTTNFNVGKNDGSIGEIVTQDHNLKDKVEDEWKDEGNKIVEQALLNQDQIIVNEKKEQNIIGSRFTIKEKGLNIENNKLGKYKYKLHVYDIQNDKWIYDSDDYREVCEWVSENPGIYLLDLWTINKDSLKKDKKYDSWRIIPIVIQEKPLIEVESLISGHSPIYEKEKISFYVKSRNANNVQYRAWAISAQTQEIIDITNGYGNIVKSNEYYKIDMNENLKPGDYFLWIWVRDINSKKTYDNYFSYKFTCLENANKHEATIANDILFNDKDFRVGKDVVIQGIDDILGAQYKLNIYDISEKKWTTVNEKYLDEVKWTPKKAGEYLVSLWIRYGNDSRIKLNDEYDCIKLKVININDSNYLEGNEEKKYTIVNDFEELYSSIEKGYRLVIYDDKVKEAYLKCINIINETITLEMTDLEKVITVHDYIVKSTEYAQGRYLINKNDKNIYNAYGTLINNIAVCQGYADTLKMMLDLLQIENYVIQGIAAYPNGLQEHAWNLVKLDGEYYHIDATWNDPIGNPKDKSNYKFFLMNDEDIRKNHKWDESQYPKSSKSKYKYFRDVYEGVIDSEWIYYSSNSDNYNLYKVRINGEDKVRLLNSSVVDINLDRNWIYFSNYSFGGYLFKIRRDGLGLTKLNEDYSTSIIVEDKFILYQNVDDKKYYQILKDGTEKQLVDMSLYDKL